MNRARVRAITLVELMVVTTIVSILLSLLLPAVQTSREASRRAACCNNLKQVGIAVLNYEAAHRSLPVGSKQNMTLGVSWWVGIVGFLEDVGLSEQLDAAGPHAGSVWLHPANGQAVHNVRIGALSCPSSPIPPLKPVMGLQVLMPSYVGIAGATSHNGFSERRVTSCCIPENQGEISAGGVLVPNAAIRLRQVSDGLSKTLVVGEASDLAKDFTGREHRIDGGNPNGWLAGSLGDGTPPEYGGSLKPPSWNITSIRYSPNTRDYDLPGIDENRGANNPLLSCHPDGVVAATLDGAVHFVVDDIELRLLKHLATRDDSNSSIE